MGTDSKNSADTGVVKEDSFVSGSDSGTATVDDLTLQSDLPELWTDCNLLVELAQIIKDEADVVGNSSTPLSDLGTPGSPKVHYIDGDYDVSGNFDGAGLLFVTGELTMDGLAGWEGPIFVIGEGDFVRDGAGNGTISGGIIVADVAGPDRVLFTDDDCSGEDGVHNTTDDGVAQSSYLGNGGGTGTTGYCSAYFTAWQGLRPFRILAFQQN